MITRGSEKDGSETAWLVCEQARARHLTAVFLGAFSFCGKSSHARVLRIDGKEVAEAVLRFPERVTQTERESSAVFATGAQGESHTFFAKSAESSFPDDPGLVNISSRFYNARVRRDVTDSVGGAKPFARAWTDSTVSARHYRVPPYSPATPPSQSRCLAEQFEAAVARKGTAVSTFPLCIKRWETL